MNDEDRERLLLQLRRRLNGGEDAPMVERYQACEVCGQMVDLQDLTELYYHGAEAHAPRNAGPS